jgi:hypothetical protein
MERNRLQHRAAAGDWDHRAGYVAAIVRGEKNVGGRQLSRLTRAFERRVLAKMLDPAGAIVDGISGVQIGLGATQLTRIPFSARSCARPAVELALAPFWWRGFEAELSFTT